MAGTVSREVRNALAAVAISVVAYKLVKFLWTVFWEPLRLLRIMTKQGVKGPPFRPLIGHIFEPVAFAESFPEVLPLGNYDNLSPTITPQYALYCPKYGKSFVYFWATNARYVMRDAETAKEVFVTNHGSLKRIDIEETITSLVVGRGLFTLMGDKWAMERKILTPFFHQDALKGMVEAMVEATAIGIKKWEQTVALAGGSAEIDVQPDIHKISGRILSCTAFGGDFEKGELIYELQSEVSRQLFINFRNPLSWIIPNYRKIPTPGNRYIDTRNATIDALLRETIVGRRDVVRSGKTSSYGDDLLGRMLAAASEGWDGNTSEFNLASVLNNCKLFYFAGQDTVANTVVFAMLMLAQHPEWQERARREVLEVLGSEENFNASALSRLKVVGMILNETLRIFPPAPTNTRQATKDLQLKKVFIPKGMILELPITALHQDRDYWGDDVAEFNPGRFENGVSGACTHPQAFVPFGLGPKFCVGSNFALMEAKIAISMAIRRFQILPSPNYKHHPIFSIVARPKYGMPIILKALSTTL
ncbi:hypothetical protein KC19_8G023700 [Ceratodon purpureus]|uniref:Cytochrome P450 n=1 Tax=Ceratodon purpureus TaxID=3225 RepID=A0A8T0GWE1_CERPU|nr:hypothetical protein KC19_8G023700 [Ceratodon purpureus]